MEPEITKRRLLWHGFFIFLTSSAAAALIPAMANPRMGLSAHLAGALGGLFLIALGAVWNELRLSAAQAKLVFWTALSNYLGWAGILLGAAVGAQGGMTLAGAGHSASAWLEAIVFASVAIFSIAIAVCCVVILVGLRK